MTTQQTKARPPGSAATSRAVAQAAAYCGAAHGMKWMVDGSVPPPDTVELEVSEGSAWYRLARHPRTGRPAVDWHGRLLYVPARGPGLSRFSSSRQRGVKRSAMRRPLSGWESLTERELRVARLAADGLPNGEIGARLVISRHTVVFHLRNLFAKLGVRSRVDLARIVWIHEPRRDRLSREWRGARTGVD